MPLLFAYDRHRFSHDVAQIIAVIILNLNSDAKMQKEWHMSKMQKEWHMSNSRYI